MWKKIWSKDSYFRSGAIKFLFNLSEYISGEMFEGIPGEIIKIEAAKLGSRKLELKEPLI